MTGLKLWLATALALLPAHAKAFNVYPGCAKPTMTTGRTWYVDSINGKTQAAGGNGSQASPWNSLKAVTGTKISGIFGPDTGYTQPLLSSVTEGKGGGTGPIHPGDTIVVMSGNYGDVTIGDFNSPVVNSDFVTVMAAPGQTPVLATLGVSRTNLWVFNGLKVQSLVTSGKTGPLISVGDQGVNFPTTDIILNGLDVSTADHAATLLWTQAQWKTNVRSGINVFGSAGNGTNGVPYTSCVTVTNSHVHDVYVGITAMGNAMLVDGNEVDHFAADGTDYAANNLIISNNTIHDSFAIDAVHQDGLQGQNGPIAPGVAYNAFSNILIDRNRVVRQLDPALAFGAVLQGIDAFDEDWTNVTVTNNVVITSTCNGISFSSVHDSLIADNTVVDDGQLALPGCAPGIILGDKTHQGPSSTNSRMTNNTGSAMVASTADAGIVADHNVIQLVTAPNRGGARLFWLVNGVNTFISSPGTYSNGPSVANVLDNVGPAGEFTTYSPATYTYNLTPKAGAPLLGAGTSGAPLPTVDIRGVPRASPYAVGAYAAPTSVTVTFSITK